MNVSDPMQPDGPTDKNVERFMGLSPDASFTDESLHAAHTAERCQTKPKDVDELLKERKATHGEAWVCSELVFVLLQHHYPEMLDNLASDGKLFIWTMCLNKLMRAGFNPNWEDNWDDIIGYITLVQKRNEERPL